MKFYEIKEPQLPTFEQYCDIIKHSNEKQVIIESLGIKIVTTLFPENWSWHTEIGGRKGWVSFIVRGYTASKKIVEHFDRKKYDACIKWALESRERRVKEILGTEVIIEIR